MTFFVLLLLSLAVAAFAQGNTFFPPSNNITYCVDPKIHNVSLFYDALTQSTQMPAQVGAQRVAVPFNILSTFVSLRFQAWPIWNSLFTFVNVTSTNLCDTFDAVGYSNKPNVNFPPGMTAPHWIDQHGFSAGGQKFAFGWVFKLISQGGHLLVFGRHTYTLTRYVDESGTEATIVESFEKAAGDQLNSADNAYAWAVALQESLIDGFLGYVCLERVYLATGSLKLTDVTRMCKHFTP